MMPLSIFIGEITKGPIKPPFVEWIFIKYRSYFRDRTDSATTRIIEGNKSLKTRQKSLLKTEVIVV